MAAGMDDFISKPVHVDSLYRLVERWAPSSPIHPAVPEPAVEIC
jgi:FixJ family two-component response regulator